MAQEAAVLLSLHRSRGHQPPHGCATRRVLGDKLLLLLLLLLRLRLMLFILHTGQACHDRLLARQHLLQQRQQGWIGCGGRGILVVARNYALGVPPAAGMAPGGGMTNPLACPPPTSTTEPSSFAARLTSSSPFPTLTTTNHEESSCGCNGSVGLN